MSGANAVYRDMPETQLDCNVNGAQEMAINAGILRGRS